MEEIVGGSLTGMTFKTKVSIAVAEPSVTLRVMVAVPF